MMTFIALNLLYLKEALLHKSSSLFKVWLKKLYYTKAFIVFIWILIPSLSHGMNNPLPQPPLAPLEVIVKNVGQGNCIMVKMLNQKAEYDAILVDCGSSAFNRALAHTTSPRSPKSGISGPSSPRRESLLAHMQPRMPLGRTTTDITDNIKSSLKGITIKAVIITHPDKDHYNFISDIIPMSKKPVPLILGGSPKKYLNTSNPISDIIQRNLKSKKILFTASEDENPALDKLLKETFTKKPAYYPVPLNEPINEELNFNPRFLIQLLTVNSNHVTSLDPQPITINISSKEDGTDDYNTDSIIIKITDTKTGKSIILTGDATGVTTTRLMDHASQNKQLAQLLAADVLVASHHGSSSHGTNNEAWIRTVNPEFIILSTGGSYGHPTKKAYEAFHKSPRLAAVVPHSVYVGGITEESIANHITSAGIFSTLPHGDITIRFPFKKGEEIVIQPENSTTRVFHKLESKSSAIDGFKNPLSTTPELYKEIDKIPDPKDYRALINELIETKEFEPIEIDLNDDRNYFIIDFLNLKEEDIEQTKVFLELHPGTLVGEVNVELPHSATTPAGGKEKEKEELSQKNPQKTELLIDLKDPRNLYLLRQLKPLASSYSPISLSASFQSSKFHEKEKKIKKEQSVNLLSSLSEISKEDFTNYLDFIQKKHGAEELKKSVQGLDRPLIADLKKGMHPDKRQEIWEKLKDIYPDDYAEWSKQKRQPK